MVLSLTILGSWASVGHSCCLLLCCWHMSSMGLHMPEVDSGPCPQIPDPSRSPVGQIWLHSLDLWHACSNRCRHPVFCSRMHFHSKPLNQIRDVSSHPTASFFMLLIGLEQTRAYWPFWLVYRSGGLHELSPQRYDNFSEYFMRLTCYTCHVEIYICPFICCLLQF